MDSVVNLMPLGNGVGEITIHDFATKNSLTDPVVAGLSRCFEQVAQDEQYKTVILTGYGNYFLSGGTQAQLLDFQKGTLHGRSVLDIMRIIFDCPLPVISAMQGHASGGGLAFGLYADLVVLAQESIYAANFMKYGFTPGAGATFIIPAKFGTLVGQEMLLTARGYRGKELQALGVPCRVLPRASVLEYAREMANEMVDAPRASLLNLKQLMTHQWRGQFAAHFERELASFTETMQDGETARLLTTRWQ